jgi:hypothetical protein
MTLEELVLALSRIDGFWGLKSLGVENLKSGLADAMRRIQALEAMAAKNEH